MTVDQNPRVTDTDDTDAADDTVVGGDLAAATAAAEDIEDLEKLEDPGDIAGQTPSDQRPAWRHWPAAGRHWVGRCLARWRLIAFTAAVLAAVGLAVGLFFLQYRPDRQTGAAAAQAAITAASEGAVAVLSYAPDTVDHDVAAANSHLTGEFLRYYRSFGQHYVAPAVRQQDVKASATVLRAGLSELEPNSAEVLLFVHQTTTSREQPKPVVASSNVRVTLTKVDGSWLISAFEPV